MNDKFFYEVLLGLGNADSKIRPVNERVRIGKSRLEVAHGIIILGFTGAAYILGAGVAGIKAPVWLLICIAVGIHFVGVRWVDQLGFGAVKYHYRGRKDSEDFSAIRKKGILYFIACPVIAWLLMSSIFLVFVYVGQ